MSVSTTSRNYSIVEPHPSVPSTQHYISTGRGGAGNAIRASPSTLTRGSDASGPASRTPLSSSPPTTTTSRKTFTVGRGGAGNVHTQSERAIFSFDEELARQLSQERRAAPVYHVGRGGAGNVGSGANTTMNMTLGSGAGERGQRVYVDGSVRRRASADSEASSTRSHDSTGSEMSGAGQFNRGVAKGWKKVVGVGHYMTG